VVLNELMLVRLGCNKVEVSCPQYLLLFGLCLFCCHLNQMDKEYGGLSGSGLRSVLFSWIGSLDYL